MRKLACIFLLWFFFSGLCAFAATPAKPYPDVVTGDTLTATWLMGTVDTIYTWAQGANTSINDLVTQQNLLTASVTISVASTAVPLVFDSTALGYYTMTGSGTMGYDVLVTAVASNSAGSNCWRLVGGMLNNATGTYKLNSESKTAWKVIAALDVSTAIATPGIFILNASSTANVKWKAQIRQTEVDW